MKKLNSDKITIVCLHLGVGGVEKFFSSLCLMLEKNYEIDIISSYKVSEKPGFNFNKKIKIKYLINDRPYKYEFIDAIRKFNIIGIIKYGLKNAKILFLKSIKEPLAIKKIDSKFVITTLFHSKKVGKLLNDRYIKISTEHNYHNNNKKYINKVVNSVKNIDYLVCISKELKKFYQKKVSAKCVYIPNVIDSIPKIKYSKNKNVLIAVGRLFKEKGFNDLIDVINMIKEKRQDIILNIIGNGPEQEKLENKIKKMKLEKNVILLGEMSTEQIYEEMQKASIYLMSSYTEGFGITLIEAMINKLPVIAFDTSNGAKTLLKNNNGILIKNRNKKQMAESIIYYLENYNELEEYIKNGYNESLKYLSSNVKKNWIELLKGEIK